MAIHIVHVGDVTKTGGHSCEFSAQVRFDVGDVDIASDGEDECRALVALIAMLPDLEAAVRFYANFKSWREKPVNKGIGVFMSDAVADSGAVARDVVARIERAKAPA